MRLGDLKPASGSKKKRKRVGCGPGSGHGKTATRGNKGTQSRTGNTRKAYYEHVSVHPDDLARLTHINDDVLAGRASRIDFEYRILLPGGGGVRWILTRAQCFRDGQGKALRMAACTTNCWRFTSS